MSEPPVEPTDQQESWKAADSGPERLGEVTVFRGADGSRWARFRRSSSFGMVVGGVVTVVIAGIVAGVAFSGSDDPAPPAAGSGDTQALVPPAADPSDPWPPGMTAPGAPGLTPEPGSVAGPGPGAGATDPDTILKAAPPATAGGPRTTAAEAAPGTTATAAGTAAPKPPATPANKVTYSAIAGLGCDAASTTYSRHGWFKAGNAGWWTLAQGSTREGGCSGELDDMPMSGGANATDHKQGMIFGFRVGGGRQNCALGLYIPSSSSPRDVIANPVYLVVMTGTGVGSAAYSSPAGYRAISQRDNHNSWISLGTYPVSNGLIGVKLTNRGAEAGYPVTYPHIAGGAVRARCVTA